MNKTFFSVLLACFFTSAIIESCSQSAAPSTTVTTTVPSLNQLLYSLRFIPQNLAVTAGRDTIVYGADSTLLHFYATSFKDANGNIISSGVINLQLIEMYKPGDYIANRMTTITVANNGIVTSGGAISLLATMSGQSVVANKYGVGFKQAAASSQPMQLYYGDTANTDTVTTWTQGNNGSGATATSTIDSVDHQPNTSLYFNFDSSSDFNWVSCDNLLTNSSSLTNVSVIVPGSGFNNTNTEIFIIFPANAIIVPLEQYDATTNTFSIQTAGTYVPVGLNYELVTITYNAGWYYFEQSGITTSGMSVTAAPSVATLTGLAKAVSDL